MSTENTQRVYSFGAGKADGDGSMKELLGGKGAGLAEMTRIGIPVPPGFTITTKECIGYQAAGNRLGDDLRSDVDAALAQVESVLGARFGNPENPLLVSVRSGARESMPGMMDTILNVGLNDKTTEGLAVSSGDARFAYDSYRRFIQMFGDVVLGVDHYYFEEELEGLRKDFELASSLPDSDLGAAHWKALIPRYKALIAKRANAPFPEDPREQLLTAVSAVFDSWHNERAQHYRNLNEIPHHWGTAVNVQAMVFGNLGGGCATGVAFTRNPATGEKGWYGEFLPNAQGEDVVAGVRTGQPLCGKGGALPSLEETMPDAYGVLSAIQTRLEGHYKDMQDIEFTIQKGKVWILQTRNGKRTAAASLRIAVELVNEGIISKDEALLRISPKSLEELLHPAIDPDADKTVIAKGLAAGPGAATGAIVLTADDAAVEAERGMKVVLVRNETTPEDIKGMTAAQGVLTARGGITSHAAVVARQMGKCCVAGCHDVSIDLAAKTLKIGEHALKEGDIITLDGTTGEVLLGAVPKRPAQLSDFYEELMSWADARKTVGVFTNADNGPDAENARRFGARGIGLTRTEHMFFADDRINWMREMILAENKQDRMRALEQLRPVQRRGFDEILRAMDGLPVTIRLLDPPLHEFLPNEDADIAKIARSMDKSPDEIRRIVDRLHESNPMLGHRGCRLGITIPEIYEMQVRAIFDATVAVAAEGLDPRPQIMVPLVSIPKELAVIRARIEALIPEYPESAHELLSAIPIGTMIELPRACVRANEIARHADFLSFGTNDLTQTTFGFSRDDASSFLPAYVAAGILDHDPFVVLDTGGVGEMIKMACQKARGVKFEISIGICGEHGGEARSVSWIQRGIVDYVSCSPFRVPVARLSAAQAAIRDRMQS